jgi:Tol biopolymer transport system component
VRPDGSRLLQLTNLAAGDSLLDPDGVVVPSASPSGACGPSIHGLRWSPDGDRLAVGIGSCQSVVLTLGLDGVPHAVGAGASPAWSPDGTQILYATTHPPPPCPLDCYAAAGALEIHLADASAAPGNGAPITASSGIFAASSPVWSPDGTRIAFAAIDGSFVDQLGSPLAGLYVANADGAEQVRIATGRQPRWSPDGLQLAFTDAGGNLAVIPAEGGEARVIGRGGDAEWSPDGSRVAFSVSDGAGITSTHIRVAADGSVVADIPGHLQGWAPDGSELLLTVQRFGGGIELQRYTLDTGAVEVLAGTDTQTLTTAAWQPVVISP